MNDYDLLILVLTLLFRAIRLSVEMLQIDQRIRRLEKR
jgi:hypothetical protein